MARAYEACRTVTRENARSFYLASHALDPTRRRSAYAIYAFCRRVDDAIDEAEGAPREELESRVIALRAQLDDVCGFAPLDDAVLLALRDTMRRHGIAREPLDELIDGVALDVTLTKVADEAELLRYCYLVAGTVGLLMATVFGVDDREALGPAVDLGVAMQLTNILRDVREDYVQRGRVYLPQTMLDRYEISRESLGEVTASPALRAIAREVARMAEARYVSADAGVPHITSRTGRVATTMMRGSYSEILEVLRERDFDLLAGRAVVSTQRKLSAIARTVWAR